jgi:ribosomal protein L11 methyltransferase
VAVISWGLFLQKEARPGNKKFIEKGFALVTTPPLCFELGICVPEQHKDLLSGILADFQVHDFVWGSIDCNLDAEFNPHQKVQGPNYDAVLAQNTSPALVYSFDEEFLKTLQRELEHRLPLANIPQSSTRFFLAPLANQNWHESWKESFAPVCVGEVFAVLPPWENPAHFQQKHKIIIDPGMAFGTGQHETTRLCLQALAQCFEPHGSAGHGHRAPPGPQKVLDVGTGSGILAIAARMLGATQVFANDLDTTCLPIAKRNAQENGICDIVWTPCPVEDFQEHQFHCVVANIQCKPLCALLGSFQKLLNSHTGILIVSGILTSEEQEFCAALTHHGFVLVDTLVQGDWCALRCTKGAP